MHGVSESVCIDMSASVDANLMFVLVVWSWICFLFEALMAGSHPPLQLGGAVWPAGSKRRERVGTKILGGEQRFTIWNVTGDFDMLSNDMDVQPVNSNDPLLVLSCVQVGQVGHAYD